MKTKTKRVSVSEARTKLGSLVKEAMYSKPPICIIITVNGKDVVCLDPQGISE